MSISFRIDRSSPFKIAYDTPETLGTDRIAGMAGAFSMFPLSDLLLIDAGTAITYDYLSEGIYKGGNISPGLNMRFRALNKFTGKLPLLTFADNFSNPGRNTYRCNPGRSHYRVDI